MHVEVRAQLSVLGIDLMPGLLTFTQAWTPLPTNLQAWLKPLTPSGRVILYLIVDIWCFYIESFMDIFWEM